MTDEHVITLGIGLEGISHLNDWFDALVVAREFPGTVANEIKLCLNEAVTNTLSYGFSDRTEGAVAVIVLETPTGLDVTIRDNGTAFDPMEFEVQPFAETVEEARIGGLGVFLIKEFASDVSYAREEDENVLKMRFTSGDT